MVDANGEELVGKLVISSSVESIGESEFEDCSDQLVLYVTENSYAHSYALENDLKYQFT